MAISRGRGTKGDGVEFIIGGCPNAYGRWRFHTGRWPIWIPPAASAELLSVASSALWKALH